MEEDGLDFALSQALDIAEAGESLNEMSLTQTVEVYKVEEAEFADFEMFEGLDDLFDTNEEDKNRFGPLVEEEEIYILLKSRLKARTRVKTLIGV